ncbi:carbohydrate ABC transporter permease [Mesorhizobium sp. L-8-3]|nr:sugar ABC transporter permease [Mesorhizobium sp. L-8-3]BCH27910.1 sugar ABC transporter permease [Mesorhizobium sp. L-8-3]
MRTALLPSRRERRRIATAWLFVAPMLLVLAAVAAWPLGRTIYFSFTDASLGSLDQAAWIGFRNYYDVVTLSSGRAFRSGLLADPVWWTAVWNTIRFAAISVFFETVFGTIIALVLNAEFRGRGLVRAAVLIPWAIPTIVSARIWAWMMNDQFGMINDLLLRLSLIDRPVAWTASPDTALMAVLVVDIWKSTPFMALLILAALQMLPADIYDAARLDGARPTTVFFRITLPLIRPALVVAIIFRTLDALRVFDVIYVLTPNNESTKSMSVFAQENLFAFDKFAYGSAASTLLFLVIALVTAVTITASRLRLGEERWA